MNDPNFLRSILDSMTHQTAVIDRSGVILMVNRAWTDFAIENGVDHPDVVGPGVNYLGVCESATDRFFRFGRKAARGIRMILEAECPKFRLHYPCPDESCGRERWFLMEVTPLSGSSERMAVITHTDITSRMRAERRSREYQLAVEGSEDMIATVDERHIYRMVNRSYLEQRSLHRSSVIGKSVPEILGTEIYETTVKPHLDRCFQGETVEYEMDQEYHGEKRHVLVRYFPVKEQQNQGNVHRVVGLIRDITERKRTEQALRQTSELYKSLFEKNLSVMLLIDPESGSIVDANNAAAEYYGFSVEKLKQKTIADINVLSREEVHAEMERAEREERNYFIFRHRLVSGAIRPVEVYSGPVRIQGKNLLYSIVHDISERVETRSKLMQVQENLEQRVRERTRELEKASQAKDEFLANMSHEIRTPMTGILGMTEMMLGTDLCPEARANLTMIKDSADSLLHLINDILDLSRIEAGKIDLDTCNFNLQLRLKKLVTQFGVLARTKGLRLVFRYPDATPRIVHADAERVMQIVSNLLSNAIKFTDEGTVGLTVRTVAEDSESYLLCIAVSDTGIGIPEEKMKSLFQVFTQLDSSYSKRHKGSGLGLAISKRLAEIMGGTLEVESDPGKGSTFRFRFRVEKPAAYRRSGKKEDAGKTGLKDVRPLEILLAEDNRVNQLFMTRTLETAGHRVVTVSDGREVIDVLKERSFNLVLMDVQMPIMDGLEATRRIRAGDAGQDKTSIPIIALTAYAMKGDRERFLQAGMNEYVSKPVDFTTLAGIIGSVVDG
ncbi:MAG: PAS domain S-box protein [Desulfovibrionales bacterium]